MKAEKGVRSEERLKMCYRLKQTYYKYIQFCKIKSICGKAFYSTLAQMFFSSTCIKRITEFLNYKTTIYNNSRYNISRYDTSRMASDKILSDTMPSAKIP